MSYSYNDFAAFVFFIKKKPHKNRVKKKERKRTKRVKKEKKKKLNDKLFNE